ncbi:MAG: hypothetical protein ING71_19715 [Rhodocyclaceae bacterium]|nr:hypothetical protein [Rhodocyclaceae bacterium]
MTKTLIRRADISEFGIYNDGGAIVLGFRFATVTSFGSLIFEIDNIGSDQRCDQFGMYSEIDGKGKYGAVRRFDFSPEPHLLEMELDPEMSCGHAFISIELPLNATQESLELVAKMAEVFRDYPVTTEMPAMRFRKQ